MKNKINLAIQLLPFTSEKEEVYSIVDKAIEIIDNSGLKYKVSPYETVIEGYYDDVMKVLKQIQEMAINQNIDTFITNMKLHIEKNKDVLINDKLEKY